VPPKKIIFLYASAAFTKATADDIVDYLGGLSAAELAALTDSHVTTARRWLRTKKVPPVVLRCLAVLLRGELGAVSREWAGWTLRRGELYSPEGVGFTPGHVRAGPLHANTARELRRQLSAITAIVEASQERRERVEALAALHNAQAAAQAALHALTADLTSPEQNQLFETLDSTKQRRVRNDK
jgi:hypothetical protein